MISQEDRTALVADAQERIYSAKAGRDESYDVIYHPKLLRPEDAALASVLRPNTRTLVVTTPAIDRLYGERLRHYLSRNCGSANMSFMVLACSERQKGMDEVLAVCRHAAEAQLARRSQIVCIGGGVALDICGLAATLFRRGIPCVRVPTTLIGMIDAAIGVKNGINFGGAKSLLGSFSAPEVCLVDSSFLATLPCRHLQCGLAESIKIATMCSRELFDHLDQWGHRFLNNFPETPSCVTKALIQESIYWTLKELELNLFERNEIFPASYARKLDFGHTFSPYIEAASHHDILHGEAVAIDMAISSELSLRLGLLDEASHRQILGLLRRLSLPVYWPGIDVFAMHASLHGVVRHRNGNFNLVVPTGIGSAAFIKDLSEISATLLDEVLQGLAASSGEANEMANWQATA